MNKKCRCPLTGIYKKQKFGQPIYDNANRIIRRAVKTICLVSATLLFTTAFTYAPVRKEVKQETIINTEKEEVADVIAEPLDLEPIIFTSKDFDGDCAPVQEVEKETPVTKPAKKNVQSTKKIERKKATASNSSVSVNSNERYPVAQKIWNYLKGLGYTNEQAAGILGNMMVEAGGNTLNIDPSAHNSNHWGICQWSKKWCPEAWGMNLDEQLSYLKKYISKKPINGSAGDVAYWFWKNYEKSGHYSQKRTECALVAYNYFK